MNIKNAIYKNEAQTIVDVEIEHPQYGLISYTFKSDEADQSSDKEIRSYLETATIAEYVAPPPPTAQEIAATITAKATSIIEAEYSPLKQRKLMSIAISIQDKQLQGETLSVYEEVALQSVRDSNSWISSIRTTENTAIANGTLLEDINWGV